MRQNTNTCKCVPNCIGYSSARSSIKFLFPGLPVDFYNNYIFSEESVSKCHKAKNSESICHKKLCSSSSSPFDIFGLKFIILSDNCILYESNTVCALLT